MSKKENSTGSEEGILITQTHQNIPDDNSEWQNMSYFEYQTMVWKTEYVIQYSGTLSYSSVGNIACNVHLVDKWMIRGGYIPWWPTPVGVCQGLCVHQISLKLAQFVPQNK